MYFILPSSGSFRKSSIWWILCGFLLFSAFPMALQAQARVDLVESGPSGQGQYFEYRIVGASFSGIDQLKRFEKVNQETNTFSAFTYDEKTHICRVETNGEGSDRDEGIIRYFIGEAVGVAGAVEKQKSNEWADDDPRHRQMEAELPTAIPEPTNPDDMPDWSHLQNQNSNIELKGDKE